MRELARTESTGNRGHGREAPLALSMHALPCNGSNRTLARGREFLCAVKLRARPGTDHIGTQAHGRERPAEIRFRVPHDIARIRMTGYDLESQHRCLFVFAGVDASRRRAQ